MGQDPALKASRVKHLTAYVRQRPLLGASLVLAAVGGGIWALYWAIGPRSDTARNEFTRTVVQILGGLALLASLYFTYRNLQVNLDTQLENQKANRERERLSQEANLTDRFAKAVEQLASDKLEVRLGAIYALERLARDSERDHATIMELLTAYVRERAPRQDGEGHAPPASGEATARLVTDIQATLTVIGRRSRWLGQGESRRLDLRHTGLAHADLTQARLGGTNLEGADLRGARLWSTDLGDACLWGADLRGAVGLAREQLRLAHLSDATKLPDYLRQAASAASSADTAAKEQPATAEGTTAARDAPERRAPGAGA